MGGDLETRGFTHPVLSPRESVGPSSNPYILKSWGGGLYNLVLEVKLV